jgi:type IV pilus assembly protein PilV
MLMNARYTNQRGVSLVEVLVTMVIVAFGLLGLAAFQSKAQIGSVESYQRAQAAVLLQDMQARLTANMNDAANYVTDTALGTGNTTYSDCSALAAGSARDKCEWDAALKGASETTTAGNVGAIKNARGCIQRVQLENTKPGVCTPAVYMVTVAWQGLHVTKEPSQTCGAGQYGGSGYRRAISARVAVGLRTCT